MDGYYRRPAWVASRVVDGEGILVHVPEGKLYVLNATATRMWVRADGTRSGVELVSGLRETSEEPSPVESFLSAMVGLGLFERASTPSGTADAFPQDVEWPEERRTDSAAEPPAILASEPVEAIAGECSDQISWPACEGLLTFS